MDWLQFLILLGSFVGTFWLIRGEFKVANDKLEARVDSYRQETASILNAIQAEIKDFHGRLCAIEERNRK